MLLTETLNCLHTVVLWLQSWAECAVDIIFWSEVVGLWVPVYDKALL